MPTLMSLGRMVDLALGTPDVGSVNFNVLHSLLRAMVNHLGIVDVKAEVSDEAEEVLRVHGPTTDELDQPKKDSEETDERGKVDGKRGRMKGEAGGGEGGGRVRRRSTGSTNAHQVKELEKKVEKLEQQWKELNSYPSNEELVDCMRSRRRTVEEEDEAEDGEGQRTRRRPVTDMWLSLQLSKKVDANTEGVSKVHPTYSYIVFL